MKRGEASNVRKMIGITDLFDLKRSESVLIKKYNHLIVYYVIILI